MTLNEQTEQYRLLILRQSQALSALLCVILCYFTFMDIDSRFQDALVLLFSFMGYSGILWLSFKSLCNTALYQASCFLTLLLIGYFLSFYPLKDSPALPWLCVLPTLLIFFLEGWALRIASACVISYLALLLVQNLHMPQPPSMLSPQHTMLFFVSCACALGYSFFISFAMWQGQRIKQHVLFEQQLRDPLTGAYNRRGLQEFLQNLQVYKQTKHLGLGVIMLDIDDFKKINDEFGHLLGDEVIQMVSQRLRENVRVKDIVVRYGGEEFMILLNDISLHELNKINERILHRIQSPMLRGTEDDQSKAKLSVTISGGCVYRRPSKKNQIKELIELADKKLFEAKNAGKNQIVQCSV